MSSRPVTDDADELALDEIVEALMRVDASIAKLEAERARLLGRAYDIAAARTGHKPLAVQERELALRSAAAEIGAALRWHDRTAQRRLSEAASLVDDFPATVQALAEARISARHAEVVREIGACLVDEPSRRQYERRVLTRAERDTVAGTRAFARAVVDEL